MKRTALVGALVVLVIGASGSALASGRVSANPRHFSFSTPLEQGTFAFKNNDPTTTFTGLSILANGDSPIPFNVLTGSEACSFVLTQLAPGATCYLYIEFDPASSGHFRADFSLSSAAGVLAKVTTTGSH